MPNFQVDWMAECSHCGQELGRGFCDYKLPESDDFNTSECTYCSEEICGACGDNSEIHPDCAEELKAEEAENEVSEDA